MTRKDATWKREVIEIWSAERAASGRIIGIQPPTDEELRRLLDLAQVAVLDAQCPGCRWRGKACSFCRRVTPGSKGLPGEKEKP